MNFQVTTETMFTRLDESAKRIHSLYAEGKTQVLSNRLDTLIPPPSSGVSRAKTKDASGVETTFFTQAFKGDKWLFKRQPAMLTETTTDVFDGKSHINVLTSTVRRSDDTIQKLVQANRQDVNMTTSGILNYGWMQKRQWIGDYLRANKAQVTGVEDDPKFGKLHILSLQEADRAQRFWLAERYGYLPVRIETVVPEAKTERFTIPSLRNVHELLTVRQIDGVYLPTEMTSTSYEVGNETQEPFAKTVTTIKSITLNNVKDSLFEVKLPAGTPIKHGDQYLRTSANGEEIVVQTDTSSSRMYLGWLLVGSVTVLMLTGLGAFMQWRKRRLDAQP